MGLGSLEPNALPRVGTSRELTPCGVQGTPPRPVTHPPGLPAGAQLGRRPAPGECAVLGTPSVSKAKAEWHVGCKPATDHTWTQRTCERPAKARLRRQRLTVPRPLARIHQKAARPARLGPEAPRMDAGLQQLLLFNLRSDSGGSVGLTPKKVHSGGSAGPVARETPAPELELGLAVRRMQERGHVPDGTRHLLSSEQT